MHLLSYAELIDLNICYCNVIKRKNDIYTFTIFQVTSITVTAVIRQDIISVPFVFYWDA